MPLVSKTTVPMRLTDDDLRLLAFLRQYRFLETRQFYRLMEPRAAQNVRRRLRLLRDGGLIHGFEHRVGAYDVYCLLPAGLEALGEEPEFLGYAVDVRTRTPDYRAHAVMINDIRMAVELSLHARPDLAMPRWIPEYELANPRASKPHEKFVLREEIIDGKQRYFLRPDAAFFLYSARMREPDRQVMYFLEADRATQTMTVIHRKLLAYYHYGRQRFVDKRHRDYPEVVTMRILFVLDNAGPRRIESMREAVKEIPLATRVRYTTLAELSGANFFSDPVWVDHGSGARVALHNTEREGAAESAAGGL